MSEHIFNPDHEFTIEWGSVRLRVEDAVELRQFVAQDVPTDFTLSSSAHENMPIKRSSLEYSRSANSDLRTIHGAIVLDESYDGFESSVRTLASLAEYFLDEAEFDESMIDISVADTQRVILIHPPGSNPVYISYMFDREENPTLVAYMTLPDNPDKRYENVVAACHVWTALHDFAVWTSDQEPGDHPTELVIKQITQPETALTLWQALTDYETWKRDIGSDDLPIVDHANFNLGKLAVALDTVGRSDYDVLFDAVRDTAVKLRQHGKTTLGEADIIVSLLT
jgi:hypothetical protein